MAYPLRFFEFDPADAQSQQAHTLGNTTKLNPTMRGARQMIERLPIETIQSAPMLPVLAGSVTTGVFGEPEEAEAAAEVEAFDSSTKGGEGGMGVLFSAGAGADVGADTVPAVEPDEEEEEVGNGGAGIGAGAWSSAPGPSTGTHAPPLRSYPALHEAQMAAFFDVHAAPVAATPCVHVQMGGGGGGAGVSATHAPPLSLYFALHDAQMAASLDVHATPVAATPFGHVQVGGSGCGDGTFPARWLALAKCPQVGSGDPGWSQCARAHPILRFFWSKMTSKSAMRFAPITSCGSLLIPTQ